MTDSQDKKRWFIGWWPYGKIQAALARSPGVARIEGPPTNRIEVMSVREHEEKLADLRGERAPDVAEALFELIQTNEEPPPEGKSFFAAAIYELATAYGGHKLARREMEGRIDKALAASEIGDIKAMTHHLNRARP